MGIKQEPSTPEELKASYDEARLLVISVRASNNGSIPNDWGQAKEAERFCQTYKKDQKVTRNHEAYDQNRKERGGNKNYRITKHNDKRNPDENDDI